MSRADRLGFFRQRLPLFMSLCYTHMQSDIYDFCYCRREANKRDNPQAASVSEIEFCFCDFVLFAHDGLKRRNSAQCNNRCQSRSCKELTTWKSF